jgi:hypothetical protein
VRQLQAAIDAYLAGINKDPKPFSTKRSDSVSFAFDLAAVLVPDYEVDGLLFLDRHYEGGYIYRELIIVEAIPDESALGGWRTNTATKAKLRTLPTNRQILVA